MSPGRQPRPDDIDQADASGFLAFWRQVQPTLTGMLVGLTEVKTELQGVQRDLGGLKVTVQQDLAFAQELRHSLQAVSDHLDAHVGLSTEREAQIAFRVAKLEHEVTDDDGKVGRMAKELDGKVDGGGVSAGVRLAGIVVGIVVGLAALLGQFGRALLHLMASVATPPAVP